MHNKEIIGTIISILLVFVVCLGLYLKVKKDYNTNLEIYNHQIDSLTNKVLFYEQTLKEYVNNGDILLVKLDSLNTVADSINNELNVANFKIERIKYYNEIAAKNNNIKYLRGWINRVIEN